MPSPTPLPTGQVTFLFTDIEGSTRLLESLGDAYTAVLERHHELMRAAVAERRGLVVATEGDAFFAVFEAAGAAVGAAADAQRALAGTEWPEGHAVKVRMGLHTGEGRLGGDNYVGLDVHRAARIASAAHGGQVLLSRATVEASGGIDGGLDGIAFGPLGEHRLKDLSRAELLYQLLVPGLPSQFPPPRTLNAVPNNLPSQLTSFVGRTREAATVRDLLRGGARLLTLVGPGGTGKTRLALQVAADLIDRYRDGVTFVDLSQTATAELVEAAIAEPLNIVDAPDQPLGDRLIAHLRDRELLLVLDNFEQVVDAAPIVSRIVRDAPRVAALVTSRAPLRVSGERDVEVAPLPVPGAGGGSDRGGSAAVAGTLDLEVLARNDAVALFVERASAVRGDFRLTEANAAAVAEICRRLDGIPLAIELAAARVRLLPPPAILARLERDLELLSGGARDLPERQRTLRATIAWSHQLLDEPARRLFARCAVFAGGMTFEACERVGGPDEDLGGSVFDAISELIDQSLVRQDEHDGEPRLHMLGTIRAFAAEQLAPDEADRAGRRHADVYLELAETAAPELLGTDRRAWLDRLSLDHDNLRAAFDWGIRARETELTARLAAAMWRFWQMRGHLVEGRARLTEALRLPDLERHPDAYARLLTAAGGVEYWLGDQEASARAYRRANELLGELSDPALKVEVMTNAALEMSGELPALGSPEFQALIARRLAMLDEALALARSIGDPRAETMVQWTIGTALEWTGDYAGSRARFGRCAELARRCGDHFHASWATSMLGSVALREGDLEAAGNLARDALRDFVMVDDLSGIMLNLAAIAMTMEASGDLAGAMRLHGAAATFAAKNGSQYLAMERSLRGEVDPAELARGDSEAAAAYEAGRAMALPDAIAFALGDAPPD